MAGFFCVEGLQLRPFVPRVSVPIVPGALRMARPSPSRRPQGFDSKAYLGHLTGLSLLLSWQSRWQRLRSQIKLEGPTLQLDLLASQRFALGFPTRPKYGRHPFLAVQPDEALFFRRICWAGAWIDLPATRLIVSTQKMLGDGENVEDIPAMAVSIAFDHERKLEALSSAGRLVVRSLWFDEEGPRVAAGLPMANMHLKVLGAGESVFPPGACDQERSLDDLVSARLASTNRDYLPYEGSAVAVAGDFRDLIDPFDSSKVPSVRPGG